MQCPSIKYVVLSYGDGFYFFKKVITHLLIRMKLRFFNGDLSYIYKFINGPKFN